MSFNHWQSLIAHAWEECQIAYLMAHHAMRPFCQYPQPEDEA